MLKKNECLTKCTRTGGQKQCMVARNVNTHKNAEVVPQWCYKTCPVQCVDAFKPVSPC